MSKKIRTLTKAQQRCMDELLNAGFGVERAIPRVTGDALLRMGLVSCRTMPSATPPHYNVRWYSLTSLARVGVEG